MCVHHEHGVNTEVPCIWTACYTCLQKSNLNITAQRLIDVSHIICSQKPQDKVAEKCNYKSWSALFGQNVLSNTCDLDHSSGNPASHSQNSFKNSFNNVWCSSHLDVDTDLLKTEATF